MKSNIHNMEHLTPDECSPCLPAISTYLKQALSLQQPEDEVSIPDIIESVVGHLVMHLVVERRRDVARRLAPKVGDQLGLRLRPRLRL